MIHSHHCDLLSSLLFTTIFLYLCMVVTCFVCMISTVNTYIKPVPVRIYMCTSVDGQFSLFCSQSKRDFGVYSIRLVVMREEKLVYDSDTFQPNPTQGFPQVCGMYVRTYVCIVLFLLCVIWI